MFGNTAHRIFLCPDWAIQAVLERGDNPGCLLDGSYMKERFSLADIAFINGFYKYPGVKRFFGDYFAAHSYANDESSGITLTRSDMIGSGETMTKEIAAYLTGEATTEDKKSGLYRMFFVDGVTIIGIKKGFLQACENDNFMLEIFRKVATDALASEPMSDLFRDSAPVRRWLQLAAMCSPKRPRKPVFQ